MFDVEITATVDDLEQGLLAREEMITQLRLQQAEILRSLDAMQVCRVDGARSLQEWTRGRLDVSGHTAGDLVDAARSLSAQEQLVDLATDSGLSFERLAATSRLMNSGADEALVAESFKFDLAGVARLRRRHRRISRSSERETFSDRHVYFQDSLDGARGRFGGELPGFEYRILSKALGERADMFGDLPGQRLPGRSGSQIRWCRSLRTLWISPSPMGDPVIEPTRSSPYWSMDHLPLRPAVRPVRRSSSGPASALPCWRRFSVVGGCSWLGWRMGSR